MRLRYSIRFLTTQTITATPHVFPEYPEPAWRGLVVMKALTGTISPMPRMEGVQSPQDVIVFRARALYQAGLTYTFTIDMVPDFVFEGTESGRSLCSRSEVYEPHGLERAYRKQSGRPLLRYDRRYGDFGEHPLLLPTTDVLRKLYRRRSIRLWSDTQHPVLAKKIPNRIRLTGGEFLHSAMEPVLTQKRRGEGDTRTLQ